MLCSGYPAEKFATKKHSSFNHKKDFSQEQSDFVVRSNSENLSVTKPKQCFFLEKLHVVWLSCLLMLLVKVTLIS